MRFLPSSISRGADRFSPAITFAGGFLLGAAGDEIELVAIAKLDAR